MARRSVAVLSSSGFKIRYTTYRLAAVEVAAGRAVEENDRCIRLLASCDGVEWRRARSGRYGPEVRQVMRRLRLDEKEVSDGNDYAGKANPVGADASRHF
jgi:hypothetical protein